MKICPTLVFFRKTQVYGNSDCVYLFPRAAITNWWGFEATVVHSHSKKTEIKVRTTLLLKALGEKASPHLPVCRGFRRFPASVSMTATSASPCTWPLLCSPCISPLCLSREDTCHWIQCPPDNPEWAHLEILSYIFKDPFFQIRYWS